MKVKKAIKELKEKGFYKTHTKLDTEEIEKTLKELEELYKDLKDKDLFKSQEYGERDGYAVLVGKMPCKCNFLNIENFQSLLKYYEFFKDLLETSGNLLEEKEDFPLLLNWQRYHKGRDNSLPFHVDVDIKRGNWGKESISIEEGIIPKYVMVVILRNDNGSKGLKVKIYKDDFERNGLKFPNVKTQKEDGKEFAIIDIDLEVGDVLVFDNTIMLHGVPESLPEERVMFGFRSFVDGAIKYFRAESERCSLKVGNYLCGDVVPMSFRRVSGTFGCGDFSLKKDKK
jgi:hypothetical protein